MPSNEALAIEAQNGSKEAADELIKRFEPMCWKRAWSYRKLLNLREGCGISLEDIAQLGRIGVWEAIQRFDPKRSNKFAVVAHLWIHAKARRVAQDLTYAKRAAGTVQVPDVKFHYDEVPSLVWNDRKPWDDEQPTLKKDRRHKRGRSTGS